MSDLVSIIIPTFNRAQIIGETIESALEQSHRDIEILVVDDGSTDDTDAVIRRFIARDPRVSYHRQENRGVGTARQLGFERSRGAYIQFLDSDDLLSPRKIELQVEALKRDPGAGVAYGPTYFFHDGWQAATPSRRTGESVEKIFPAMVAERIWQTMSPIYRREVCVAAGEWTALTSEEDWEFDTRVAALGIRAVHVPSSDSYYRIPQTPRKLTEEQLDRKFRDRAAAHLKIAEHALAAGASSRMPEVRKFARYTFFLARRCAERGLTKEAKALTRIASSLTPHLDVRAYRLLSSLIGWRRAARIAKMREEPE